MTDHRDEPPRSRIPEGTSRLSRLRTRLKRVVPFGAGVLAAFLAVAGYGVLAPPPRQLTQSDVTQSVARALASATPAAPALAQLAYADVQQSLVLIETQTASGSKSASALGSGVIIDDSGDILTSLHVVATATSISVTFADGTKSDATVAVRRPDVDTAVLKASSPPANLTPATLGNPNAVQVGSEAFVVGNPFGLYGSMSAGVVSGLNRTFQVPNSDQVLHGLIQVDAAVNPGNSGGPLLNRDGQVIGIVAALYNPNKEDVFIGIGLAVPIDVAGGAAGLPQY